MICKRGDADCRMIGCDCYRTAPIEDVDAELREAGIDPEELVKLTNATLKLIHRNLDLNAALAAEKAKVRELVDCLTEVFRLPSSDTSGYQLGPGIPDWLRDEIKPLIEKYKEEANNNE